MTFRGHFDYSLDAKHRLNVPPRFRAAFAAGVVLSPEFEPCVGIWAPDRFDDFTAAFLQRLNPISPDRRQLERFFGRAFDTEIDAGGRVTLPQKLLAHAGIEREVAVIGRFDHLEVWDRARWDAYEPELELAAPAIAEGSAILLDMTRTHVPVLAGELIELLDPAPGETAVDCTFGAGGHARLVAERLGAGGTLVCVDRDPAAEERFEEFASEVACHTRFLRMDYAQALVLLAAEGLAADLVYLDLGVSSMQVDAWERGFSYSYDAPLDMRMDPGQELDARAVVNGWDERRLAQLFRSYGEERYAAPIARAVLRRRADGPLETTHDLVETIKAAIPAPARFAGGHPAKRVFQAIRIAVNDELGALEHALPRAWELLRPGGRLGAIAFHSLEDRLVKRFMVELARGCVCPPELPICACGREPEAEPLTRRPVAPSPGEVSANPRAKSGRLRASRRLARSGGS